MPKESKTAATLRRLADPALPFPELLDLSRQKKEFLLAAVANPNAPLEWLSRVLSEEEKYAGFWRRMPTNRRRDFTHQVLHAVASNPSLPLSLLMGGPEVELFVGAFLVSGDVVDATAYRIHRRWTEHGIFYGDDFPELHTYLKAAVQPQRQQAMKRKLADVMGGDAALEAAELPWPAVQTGVQPMQDTGEHRVLLAFFRSVPLSQQIPRMVATLRAFGLPPAQWPPLLVSAQRWYGG